MPIKKNITPGFDSISVLNELPYAVYVFSGKKIAFINRLAQKLSGNITTLDAFLKQLGKDEGIVLRQFITTLSKKRLKPFTVRIKKGSGVLAYRMHLRKNGALTRVIVKKLALKKATVEKGVYLEYTLGKECTLDRISGENTRLLGSKAAGFKAGRIDTLAKGKAASNLVNLLKSFKKNTDALQIPFQLTVKKTSHPIWVRYKRTVCEVTGLVRIKAQLYENDVNRTIADLREEAHHKLELVLNNSNEVITFYTFLPQEKYLYVSPNIEKILGFSADQLLTSHNFFEKRLQSDLKQYQAEVKQLKKNQQQSIFENRQFDFKIRTSKSQEIWIENSLVPIRSNTGKIDFYMNIIRDITAKKEAAIAAEIQNTNYRNLLDNSPVAYLIHDMGVCVYVNNAFLQLFKIEHSEEVHGKFLLDFLPPHERKVAIERLQRLYKKKSRLSHTFNLSIPDSKHDFLQVEISSVLIKFNNRDCVLSLINNIGEQQEREAERLKNLATEITNKKLKHEIRERQEVEKILKDKTAHLSAILESSTHLVWTVDDQYRITSFNKNFADVVKLQRGLTLLPGMRIDEHLDAASEAYSNYWYPLYARAFNGSKLEFEKEDLINGRLVYRRVFVNPIHTAEGVISELSCIANDITESKNNEQRLLMQTSKLSAIFDSSHHYIWSIDREGHLTSFNRNYFDLVSALYNTIPYVGFKLDRGVLSQNKEYNDELVTHYELAFNGKATNFEIQTKDRDNQTIFLDIFLNPIYEKSEVVEVSGIAHNITDKKQVQQKMEVSLKEKEILLREVHHRVKNNMQVISSILNLQSSYVSDEYALMLLQESQNRIKTMAYIHESLYQNKSFTSVNFTEYARTLVRNIIQSYSYSSDKIGLVADTEHVVLSLDNSIPVGLILNELITNAIKHAFPGNRKGTVFFRLYNVESFVYLEVKDDGVGFAPGVDVLNSQSLGFQLVQTLTEQVDGELKYDSKPGETVISVRFRK